MHADFTHDAQAIPDLVRRIESGADLVVAEGRLEGEPSRYPDWSAAPRRRCCAAGRGARRARPGLRLRGDPAGDAAERVPEHRAAARDRRLGRQRRAVRAGGAARPADRGGDCRSSGTTCGSRPVGHEAWRGSASCGRPGGCASPRPPARSSPRRNARGRRRRSRRERAPAPFALLQGCCRRATGYSPDHRPGRRAGVSLRGGREADLQCQARHADARLRHARGGRDRHRAGRGIVPFPVPAGGKTVFYSLDDVLESWVGTRDFNSRRFVQDFTENDKRKHRQYEIFPDSGYFLERAATTR